MKNNAFIEEKLGKSVDEVSKEELIALINDLKNEKKYGLVWEDRVEEMEKLLETHYPMLHEDADKAIVTDPTKPTNLIIEGDNLHSLNTLLYTHREKVDVIYIDPPYNTGNKDFVYNDRYVDKEDSWRHSSWLSFMEKRLRLAKELLSEEGVVFISIDDNEQAQLKLLCDEVFGEQRFAGKFIWKNKTGGGNDSNIFVTEHEYIYMYFKSDSSKLKMVVPNYDNGKYTEEDEYLSERGKFEPKALYCSSIRYSDSLYYPIECPDGSFIFPNESDKNSTKHIWRWSKKTYEKKKLEGRVFFKKTKNGWRVYSKQYFLQDDDGNTRTRPLRSIIDVIGSRQGTEQLKNIMGGNKVFNNPKPKDLIKYLISSLTQMSKESIILDFFAGSGTTGHAVLELNAEDGGNRQFILCTHGKESETSEVNIAEDITYERIKRVINGYTTPKGKEVDGLTGNVKYYKTTLVEKNQDSNDLKEDMAQHAKDLLCIKENIFTETVSLDEESFLFENEQLVMGIHLGLRFDIPEELLIPLAQSSKQKLLYLNVDSIPTNEDELLELQDAGIVIKPIPKKIMDLFDESTRR